MADNSLASHLLRKSGLLERQIDHRDRTWAALSTLRAAGFGAKVLDYFTSGPDQPSCRIEIAMSEKE